MKTYKKDENGQKRLKLDENIKKRMNKYKTEENV